MKALVPMQQGQFYVLDQGHVFVSRDLQPCVLERGAKFQMTTMLQMWELLKDTELVGFYFESPYKCENKGTFLLTVMESKRGRADKCQLVIRNARDGLMIYDFPGVGSLAISTLVNKSMTDILEMQ